MKRKSLEIIYEDEYLLIVNKPAGLLSIADRYDKDKENLTGILKSTYDEIYIVHRLDFDTSGALIFAKDKETQRALSQMLEQQSILKYYLAVVKGKIENSPIHIDKPIGDDPRKKGKKCVSKSGKPSQSEVSVIETFSNYAIVEVQILTGRTHQIRVHLASIGHSLLVDKLYGDQDAFYLSSLKSRKYKTNKTGIERPLLTRQSLHSHKLIFMHPMIDGKKIEIKAEMPKDMRAAINQLRKHN
jgi:RluA family pseudouridine synthase